MIIPLLHRKPVPVDLKEHRALKLALPVTDWSVAADLNSCFIAAIEFVDAARDYPIFFVRTGNDDDGKAAIAPIAVFGLQPKQNLFLEQGRWRADYMPASLRGYPMCLGRMDAENFAVCFDSAWSGVGTDDGVPMFDADGKPGEVLQNARAQLEALEGETQRTRVLCRRLRDLDLLRPMRFDATLPDGNKLSVDGFLTVDNEKVQALDAATTHELLKSGLLGLIYAHFVSLGHMRKLLDWHLQRQPAAAPADAPAAPAA
ncbi:MULTISPECIES: SapC family protein [unclassified Rubrivivax]|uniref:SapC family protein n=1 Tax=unclassified Rubrivivax TaxID=2649762 RepID=UPI001E376512|nr:MULTISPECIES: SapC family protein [unclassified Rubrivivax]MCC9597027.1 SapC family protein [Rubrivivax sp. JA1055]MCC9646714.1 SapC family protein [Rubrivivax sp. JA1029]